MERVLLTISALAIGGLAIQFVRFQMKVSDTKTAIAHDVNNSLFPKGATVSVFPFETVLAPYKNPNPPPPPQVVIEEPKETLFF